MKKYRSEKNFFLRLASVLTSETKDFLENFLDETDKWPIDFQGILVRDIEDSEQLKLKEIYKAI